MEKHTLFVDFFAGSPAPSLGPQLPAWNSSNLPKSHPVWHPEGYTAVQGTGRMAHAAVKFLRPLRSLPRAHVTGIRGRRSRRGIVRFQTPTRRSMPSPLMGRVLGGNRPAAVRVHVLQSAPLWYPLKVIAVVLLWSHHPSLDQAGLKPRQHPCFFRLRVKCRSIPLNR